MMRLQDIENAIRELSPDELARFREWFAEYDAHVWDREFKDDVAAGRFDRLAAEAIDEVQVRRAIQTGIADADAGRVLDVKDVRRRLGLETDRSDATRK